MTRCGTQAAENKDEECGGDTIGQGRNEKREFVAGKRKLQVLNQMSKTELENSLLKEVLAEYQNELLQFKKEQKKALEDIEKVCKMTEIKVNSLENLNQILNENMRLIMNQFAGYIENEIGRLKDSNEKLIK